MPAGQSHEGPEQPAQSGASSFGAESEHDTLYEIYERLLDSVTDAEGFGGPVAHVADVDGWRLRISTSDFGDLLVSARKQGEPIVAFERGPDAWWPVTSGTTDGHLAWLADLAARVDEWQDTIQRRG